MAYQVIQALTKNVGIASPSLTSSATDWGSNVTNGNSIIVIAWTEKSPVAAITSVTDSNGNTYVKDVEATVAGVSLEQHTVAIFHAYNVVGGNKPTLTVTGTSGGRMVFGAIEVEGLDPTVASPVTESDTNAVGSTTPNSGSVTTLNPHAFVVTATVLDIGAGPNSFTPPTGFTNYVQETSTTSPAVPGSGAARFYDDITTVNPTWTIGTSANWAAVTVAYTGNPSPLGARLMVGGVLPVGGVWKKPIGG